MESNEQESTFHVSVADEVSVTSNVVPPIITEWDSAKAATNLQEHSLNFETAIPVFVDPDRIEEDQPGYDEIRIKAIGMTGEGQCTVVIYTPRGDGKRIISAWNSGRKRKERRQYYQRKGSNIAPVDSAAGDSC